MPVLMMMLVTVGNVVLCIEVVQETRQKEEKEG